MMRSTNTESGSRRRQRGFTLIELIVATAILAILVGMAVPMAKKMLSPASASTSCAMTYG